MSTSTFHSLFTTTPTSRLIPRLALSLEALDKCGKTHWALMTAPDPIAVVTNDPGTDIIIAKARAAGRKIHKMDLHFPPPPPDSKAHATISQTDWKGWQEAWSKRREAVDAIIAEKSIRTLVDDTETEVWHLAELAYFGKAQGNQNADVRTKLNADYCQQFWKLYNSRPDLNIVLIHKCGKEYKKGSDGKAEWSGGYELKGYNMIGYLVDASLRMGWNSTAKDFYITVPDNKAIRYGDPFELSGKTWWARSEEYGFGYIAMEMWPETMDTPEYWGL